MNGWIDEVTDGIVYGRMGDDLAFEMPILDVLEDQRVDLEPGMYCSMMNGHLLLHKTIWTTHDLEQAHLKAKQWRLLFQ